MMTTVLLLQLLSSVNKPAITIYASYEGIRYEYVITADTLDATPQWTDEMECPPVSPMQAVTAATKYLHTLISDSHEWRVTQVSLRPSSKGHWYYIVEYDGFTRSRIPKESGPVSWPTAGFAVPVLMNGNIVVADASKM